MKRIAIAAGGFSGESLISFRSANNVYKFLDRSLYDPYIVEITGKDWYLVKDDQKFLIDKNDFTANVGGQKFAFDCVFIAIHGTPGEDGKLQGYFDLIGMPYTTSGVLVSSLTFGKEVCQNLASYYGAKTARSVLIQKGDNYDVGEIIQYTGLPCFVKPNNGGSSINTSRVEDRNDLPEAIRKAFSDDNEVMVAEFIEGTEITCGVLQKGKEVVSLAVTEIVPKTLAKFFDFEAKYDAAKSEEITPARIPDEHYKNCQDFSVYLFKKFQLKGVARFDYILKPNGDLYFLEVNTVPGLSDASIVPKQAAYYGLSMTELFTLLIENSFINQNQ